MSWIPDDRRIRPVWLRYTAAIAFVLGAALLSIVLHSWLAPVPLAPYIAAVALAAWFGGAGPSVSAIVLSLPFISLFALEPLGEWPVSVDEATAMVVFLLVSTLLALLSAERDRAERVSRESEARFRFAEEAGRVGVWDWDAVSDRTSWSDTMWQLYGQKPGSLGSSNAAWLAQLQPDDRARIEADLARFLAGRESEYRDEFRVVLPDGAERWIEIIARVTRNDAGQAVRMSGVNLDITERKHAELAMQKSRARAEALAEATRVLTEPGLSQEAVLSAIAQQAAVQVGDLAVIRLLSADGAWLEAAAVAHPDAAVRDTVQRVLTTEHHPADRGANGAALREGRPQRLDSADVAIVSKENPDLWPPMDGVATAVLLAVPLRADERPVGTLSISRADPNRPFDAEDEQFLQELADRAGMAVARARLFAQVQANEERLRAAIESNRMVAWEWNPATDRITTSDNFAEIYGRPAFEFAGEELALIWPEDVPAYQGLIDRITSKGGTYQISFRITRPDNGQMVWLEEFATAVTDSSGRVTHVVGITQDITNRKRAEEALRASEARQAFLLALNDALQPLDDPREIEIEASRLLGEHLNVSRVSFAEIDGAHAIVRNGYVHGVAPFERRLTIADYGAALLPVYKAGESISVDDVRTDPRFTETERANYLAADIVAFAEVMLIRGGRLVGAFGAQSATPRVWTDADLELISEVAKRIWDAGERARAETALRVSENHARFLAEASEILAASLDSDDAVASVVRLAVPFLADWCVVDLLDEDHGRLHRIAVVHGDQRLAPVAEELRQRFSILDLDERHTAWNVLRTRQPMVDLEVDTSRLANEFRDERHRSLLRQLGFASELVVPLIARDRAIGVLSLVMGESGRRFALDDVAFAEALARHCALAIDNARLYRETRDAEAKVRRLFDAGVIGLVVADSEKIIEANDAFLRIVGYTRDDLEQNGLPWTALTLPDFAQLEANAIAEIEERGFCTPFETEYLRRDGTRAPILIGAAAVHGTEPPWICAVLDLTLQKASERDRIAFVEAATHDLKTPLTSLKGRVQLLMRRMRRFGMPDPESLDASLVAIDTDVNRLVTLIDDLMDVAHLRAGLALGLRPEPLDLVSLVEEGVEAARQRSFRHIIRVDSCCTSLQGEWDKTRLERVLANLLDNAVKYSPENSQIEVSVRHEEGAGGGWAVLAVADHGVGIPAADLSRIFERFERGRNVSGISGAGVGLAGARQIVTQHGGTISVESKEGVGSTFTVRLPLITPVTANGG